jgi:hypothetical protein
MKKKGIKQVKFDMCVCKVRSRSGKKANPYAACNAPVGGNVTEEVKVQEIGDEVSLSGHLFMAISHRGHFLCTVVKKVP